MNLKINTLLLVALLTGCTSGIDESLKYLKQKPPSTVPEIFAPNFISKEAEYEFGSVFNEEATEFFYGVDVNGKSEIRYSELCWKQLERPQYDIDT